MSTELPRAPRGFIDRLVVASFTAATVGSGVLFVSTGLGAALFFAAWLLAFVAATLA